MIRHCVFFRFRSDVAETTIAELMAGFAALKGKVPGIVAVWPGTNVSPEGLDRGFRDGFVMDLEDEAARDAYLVDPRHVAAASPVVALLEGGMDGVMVVDLKI